jgi:hypothetical protein
VARSVELSKLYRTKETPIENQFGVPETSGQQDGTEKNRWLFSDFAPRRGVTRHLTPSEPAGSVGMESKAPNAGMGCAEVL